MEDKFAICVFTHTRALFVGTVLESLRRQNALKHVHVWQDGHQGNPSLKKKTQRVRSVVERYPVADLKSHNGQLGFRKLILQALSQTVLNYEHIIVLEDDCFPTRDAISIFREELELIQNEDCVFSTYGHHFLVPGETEYFPRFQGWGWATTATKLRPILKKLVDCYSLPEVEYLQFVNSALTDELVRRIDVTPLRQPTATLRKFFAWDETVTLLTAMQNQTHKPTRQRCVYNFGAGFYGSHFKDIDWYRRPPYNMIALEEVWDVF